MAANVAAWSQGLLEKCHRTLPTAMAKVTLPSDEARIIAGVSV